MACIQEVATNLKREEREGGRGLKFRRHFRQLTQQLVALEDDEIALERVFPQVSVWFYTVGLTASFHG